MRNDLFESILDNVTSADMHKDSALSVSNANSDEWFGRDEDWSVYFEFKSDLDCILADNCAVVRRLWDQFMEVASHLRFVDKMYTLIFNMEWENPSWQNESFSIESVENTSEEKFNERLQPFIDKMKEYKDAECFTVFLDVELKFENTSNIRFKSFCRELSTLYRTFILEYRNNKLIENVWVEFISNRMNNESSDRFGRTDKGNMFTAKQMQSIYKRIFGRDDFDDAFAEESCEISKFGHMYKMLQHLSNYRNLDNFYIDEVCSFVDNDYQLQLLIKLGISGDESVLSTQDVFDFWKKYIEPCFIESDLKSMISLKRVSVGYDTDEIQLFTLFLVPERILLNSNKFIFDDTHRIIKDAIKRGLDVNASFEVKFVCYDENNNLVYYDNEELVGHKKDEVQSQVEIFNKNHEKYFKRQK